MYSFSASVTPAYGRYEPPFFFPLEGVKLSWQEIYTPNTYKTTPIKLSNHPIIELSKSGKDREPPKPGKDHIQQLPPELLLSILSLTLPWDALNTKLVSKTFNLYTPLTTIPTLPKRHLITAHLAIETALPRSQHLRVCICTHCGLVKPTSSFSDNQARRNNPSRICIACGILSNKYTPWQAPRVGGEKRLPCQRCKEANMLLEEWWGRVFGTELYFDIPSQDTHCVECLEVEIGCKIGEYENLKKESGKVFEQLVKERLGTEEWARLGTRGRYEYEMKLMTAGVREI